MRRFFHTEVSANHVLFELGPLMAKCVAAGDHQLVNKAANHT